METSLFSSSPSAGTATAAAGITTGHNQLGQIANATGLPAPYLLAAAAASQQAAAALHLPLPHPHPQLPVGSAAFNAAVTFPFLAQGRSDASASATGIHSSPTLQHHFNHNGIVRENDRASSTPLSSADVKAQLLQLKFAAMLKRKEDLSK